MLFLLTKIAFATLVLANLTNSASAAMRVSVLCTIDNFLPEGAHTVDELKNWISERLRIEIYDDNRVIFYLASDLRIEGKVERENSNKIAFEGVRRLANDYGQITYATYSLEWFKNKNRIFVDVAPEGLSFIGIAKGKCEIQSGQAGDIFGPIYAGLNSSVGDSGK